jgi:hypothetical protein
MKKLVMVVAVAVVFGFAVAQAADVKVISLHFKGAKEPLAKDGAGAVRSKVWNAINYDVKEKTYGPAGLVDSTGKPVASLSLKQKGNHRFRPAVKDKADANHALYGSTVPGVGRGNTNCGGHQGWLGKSPHTLLQGLAKEFPNGYDIYIYTARWSNGVPNSKNVQWLLVNDNVKAYGNREMGREPAAGNIAKLVFRMGTTAYTTGKGLIENKGGKGVENANYVKLTGLSHDVLDFQPYPAYNRVFNGWNSLQIQGIQIVGRRKRS